MGSLKKMFDLLRGTLLTTISVFKQAITYQKYMLGIKMVLISSFCAQQTSC